MLTYDAKIVDRNAPMFHYGIPYILKHIVPCHSQTNIIINTHRNIQKHQFIANTIFRA